MPHVRTPDLRRASYERYAAKPGNRAKLACRQLCIVAVRAGKLTRLPCEECGEPKSEAHHEDYSKPLEVKWLCRTHHASRHRGQPKTGRPYKTHCPRGHAMEGRNVMLVSNGEGYAKKRKCRRCLNDNRNQKNQSKLRGSK